MFKNKRKQTNKIQDALYTILKGEGNGDYKQKQKYWKAKELIRAQGTPYVKEEKI